jgi:ferredoxin
MNKHAEFVAIFKIPPALAPFSDLIATEQEIELLLALDQQALTLPEIAEWFRISAADAEQLITAALRRDLINRIDKEGQNGYMASSFYANMDYWTSCETGSWRRVPRKIQREVAEWQLQEFIRLWEPAIKRVVKNPETWEPIKNRDVLLLEQALEMVEASRYICLLPCPCKTTFFPNSVRIEGSMRLGERARLTLERGQGRSLSVEQAKAHLLHLERQGLIHTGPLLWRKYDPGMEWVSHGNCHLSYSFPFLAGTRLGLEKAYPRVHFTIDIDEQACTHCGICVGRCPLGALYQNGNQLENNGCVIRQVIFEPERCWGCGLCATACPEEAIQMQPLWGFGCGMQAELLAFGSGDCETTSQRRHREMSPRGE